MLVLLIRGSHAPELTAALNSNKPTCDVTCAAAKHSCTMEVLVTLERMPQVLSSSSTCSHEAVE